MIQFFHNLSNPWILGVVSRVKKRMHGTISSRTAQKQQVEQDKGAGIRKTSGALDPLYKETNSSRDPATSSSTGLLSPK